MNRFDGYVLKFDLEPYEKLSDDRDCLLCAKILINDPNGAYEMEVRNIPGEHFYNGFKTKDNNERNIQLAKGGQFKMPDYVNVDLDDTGKIVGVAAMSEKEMNEKGYETPIVYTEDPNKIFNLGFNKKR